MSDEDSSTDLNDILKTLKTYKKEAPVKILIDNIGKNADVASTSTAASRGDNSLQNQPTLKANLMKNISSDFSKLNFSKNNSKGKSITHAYIANDINEKMLLKMKENEQQNSPNKEQNTNEIIDKDEKDDQSMENVEKILGQNDQSVQENNQRAGINDHSMHEADQTVVSSDQTNKIADIETADQVNVPMPVINEQNNPEISQSIIPMVQISAHQANPLPEVVTINPTSEKTDQSNSNKSTSDSIVKKKVTDTIAQQQTIVDQVPIGEQIDQQNEQMIGTSEEPFNPYDYITFDEINAQQQIAEIGNVMNDQNDQQSDSLDPIIDEIVNEITQGDNQSLITPEQMDQQMPTQINAGNGEQNEKKHDSQSAQVVLASSSQQRKRGRPRKQKSAENKTEYSAAEASKKAPSKKIRPDKKYVIAKILAMLVYNKNSRIFFVEWKDHMDDSCWVHSEWMNAQEMVANFIEQHSVGSVLSAFAGHRVPQHIANLLNENEESTQVLKNWGIHPEKMTIETSIIFSKAITPAQKEKAISTLNSFLKDNNIRTEM
ncbi:hypothetical protein niasHT_023065 [Heterodera trifolii]|uniref:Chromo domain-containing protein n=1 Tax=Heterodera trifolii TaxID=157864 RepID=A0ABD2KFV9_9BILA